VPLLLEKGKARAKRHSELSRSVPEFGPRSWAGQGDESVESVESDEG
jgi:hypothetical protein